MENLLGTIYCWFEALFGNYLAEHLWGYDCISQTYGRNLFNTIGMITILISFLLLLAYYYLPLRFFNHPRSNRWWNWLIIILAAGIISFFLGYAWTINDLLNGNIGDCLMYSRDSSGDVIAELIYKKDCWLFGLANFFVSIIFSIVLTFVLKWGSRNCKNSPLF